MATIEGGVIAPGANLSCEALHQAAALLPRVAIQRTQTVIGKDTVPAMQSGIFWGYVGLIEGLVAASRRNIGTPMTVVATGGLAAFSASRHPPSTISIPTSPSAGWSLIYRAQRRQRLDRA